MDATDLGRLTVEAAASIALPCSATVILPAVLLALVGRGRTGVVASVLAGTAIGALAVLGLVPELPDALAGTMFTVGASAVVLAGRRPPGSTTGSGPGRTTGAGTWSWRGAAGPLGAGAAGLATGQLWTPCVGTELGALLTTGVRDPWPAAVPLVLFVLVLCLPVVAVAVGARTAWGRRGLDGWLVGVLGLVAIALGLALVVGLGDDVTGALFRWSA